MNDELQPQVPQPPPDALYEVRFQRLSHPDAWFGTWVRQPIPEDAKAEALEILDACVEDPDHYDRDDPQMIALKPDF
ncbi:MAG TPA: hypothetical protein VKR21_18170 [Solirubrobacteraceae bacterium]|nr:hypothetical protein [Solirubrobacteraceae bacterium]